MVKMNLTRKVLEHLISRQTVYKILQQQPCFLVVQVSLHSQDELPMMLEQGFAVGPGMHTLVSVAMTKVSKIILKQSFLQNLACVKMILEFYLP